MAVTIDSFLGVNQQTDSYELVLADAWQIVEISKATAVNLTVPPNSSVAFPVNTRIWLKRTGVGAMTVVQGSGVTVTGSSGALTDPGLNVEMVLRKTGTNTWDLQNGSQLTTNSWTPTLTGFSGTPTVTRATYFLIGKFMFIQLVVTGTSNATGFTVTIPFNAKAGGQYIVSVDDNGGGLAGRFGTTAGSNVCNVYATPAGTGGAAFTASGTKSLRAFIGIEIE